MHAVRHPPAGALCPSSRLLTCHLRRYADYKRAHSQLHHRDFFVLHKDDEWMRQQFDPRRLEEAVKQRCEAALQAAAEFDVAAGADDGADGADEAVRCARSGVRRMKACSPGRSSRPTRHRASPATVTRLPRPSRVVAGRTTQGKRTVCCACLTPKRLVSCPS
jgi:hypothetical protein